MFYPRESGMSISYKKLWKLLIDNEMNKVDLKRAAGISSVTLAKLGKNASVTTTTLVRICHALHCDTSDIMEIVENGE